MAESNSLDIQDQADRDDYEYYLSFYTDPFAEEEHVPTVKKNSSIM